MASRKMHLPSAAMLAVSGCGLFLSLGMAVMLTLVGLFLLIFEPGSGETAFPAIAFAWENGLMALLVLPAAIISLYRLLDKPLNLPRIPRWFNATTALVFWPAVLGAGFLVSKFLGLTWLFLAPLQILAIGIPIWWLVSFSGWGLKTGSGASRWKLFALSVLVGNPLVFIVELVMVLPLAVLWISGQPEFMAVIEEMAQKIADSSLDIEMLEQSVTTLFSYPGFVTAIIIGACCLAPLIEELLKTAGVWFLFKNDLTSARGLAAGAVCGAAFALVESLGLLTQSLNDQTWVAVIVGRLGTAVMHIFTASLTGWGIASLASRRKFGLTLLGYLAAMLLHGLWNFVVVVSAIHPYLDFSLPGNGFYEALGEIGMYLVAALAVAYLLGMYLVNRWLRQSDLRTVVYEVK
ncbi:MAG: PrsW family glutamic-type intramembrane protease [Anaerolineaceae bacterium]